MRFGNKFRVPTITVKKSATKKMEPLEIKTPSGTGFYIGTVDEKLDRTSHLNIAPEVLGGCFGNSAAFVTKMETEI